MVLANRHVGERTRRQCPVHVHELVCSFFFFNDPPTTEIYTVMNTLSLHDALPILIREWPEPNTWTIRPARIVSANQSRSEEHTSELQSLITISYAVFCLKKKK